MLAWTQPPSATFKQMWKHKKRLLTLVSDFIGVYSFYDVYKSMLSH